MPEKMAWVIKRRIGKRRKKTVCKGGPYESWYASFATDCRLRNGHYEVVCKDSVAGHGFGGGYLKLGSLKICKDYNWEKGKWAKAEIYIGRSSSVQEPGYDYPWLMRLRLKHERVRRQHKQQRLQRERKRKNAKSMIQDVAKIMQSLAQATAEGGSANASSAGDTDPLGAKRLMAQAKLAQAEAQVRNVVEVVSNQVRSSRIKHEANANVEEAVRNQSSPIKHEAKANVAAAASSDPTGAETLTIATAEEREMSLEPMIATLTQVIANHSQAHDGRCPSQFSLPGVTAEIPSGIGCHFEHEGRPLCRCASWPFKVCTGHTVQARTTAEVIQQFGHCRLAILPLVLIFFILLTSAAWAVLLAFKFA